MSYAEQVQKPNPSAIAATIVLNGSILTALALTTVTVTKNLSRPVTVGENIPLERETLPPEIEQQKEQKPARKPIFAPPTPTIVNSNNDTPTTTEWSPPTNFPDPDATIAEADIPKIVAPVATPVPIFIAAARDARYIKNFQPPYPTRLLQREIEGSARVKVLIGTNGRVRKAQLVSASHPGFGKVTIKQALAKWRFTPATRDGVPVEDWQTLTVQFRLDG